MTGQEGPPPGAGVYPIVVRFCLRLAILAAFATFGSIGFGKSLILLLAMSATLSAVIASIRREPAFQHTLNHWDEAVVYAALYFAGAGLGGAAAP